MKNFPTISVACSVLVALITMVSTGQLKSNAEAYSTVARPAPEFTQNSPEAWIGSEPISMNDLRGSVVLIDFWTFDCWNCYRSFPWLNALEKKYSNAAFRVIGIHTPEFAHEKIRKNVEQKIDEFDLKHPTMMDNNFAFWKKMENRYWPTYYLIDKRGYIRHYFIGETHSGTQRAQEIELAVDQLLAETSPQ